MDRDIIIRINEESVIFPEVIKLEIPDFLNHSKLSNTYTLSFKNNDSKKWFNDFAEILISKIGKEYFPIVRISDGEYKFLLGELNPYKGSYNIFKHFYFYLNYFYSFFSKFEAKTKGIYTSGIYSRNEINIIKKSTIENLRFISENGIVAFHLTYTHLPFQEYYHKPLSLFLEKNNIKIDEFNYYPFYFVYALLRGSFVNKILKDRSILIVHGADFDKKNTIINTLRKIGVKEIYWHSISSSHSLFDKVILKPEYYNVELVLVGAGIGKFNIFPQLRELNRPCIDAGFVFEAWANEENKWNRAFMVSDSDWDLNKVRFF